MRRSAPETVGLAVDVSALRLIRCTDRVSWRQNKTYTIKMKTYTMTVTEEQAEAIGYALMQAIRHNKSRRADGDHHAADLVLRLEAAYRVLDTAPEVVS